MNEGLLPCDEAVIRYAAWGIDSGITQQFPITSDNMIQCSTTGLSCISNMLNQIKATQQLLVSDWVWAVSVSDVDIDVADYEYLTFVQCQNFEISSKLFKEWRVWRSLLRQGEAWPSFGEYEGVFISFKHFSPADGYPWQLCLHGWILVILVILVICNYALQLHYITYVTFSNIQG